jgi:DNA-binding LacI/PurR family transcriptional regulator
MFRIPRRKMGQGAVKLLIELLKDDSAGPIQKTIKCKFEKGQTVSHPPDVN